MVNRRKLLIGILLVLLIVIILTFGIYKTVKYRKIAKEKEYSNSESNEVYDMNNGDNASDNNKIDEDTEKEVNKFEEEKVELKEKYDYSKLESEDNSSELFGKYYEKATNILKNMTMSERVGQLFLARYPEADVDEEIKSNSPGGYILFGKDFKNENAQSINNKLNENQKNSRIKMFLGVDEEGDEVVRISGYSQYRESKFKSPQQLYNEGGLERIISDSHEKSSLLKSLGINLNLVPVVDVSTDENSFIYSRTFGKGADETAKYSEEIIKAMNSDRIVSSMKHFPGYGDNIDTHKDIAVDERDLSYIRENDFKPFISGIKAGAPMILVSHNIVKNIDDNYPASLSQTTHKILREELNYSGLIITDDLEMEAVKEYVKNENAAVHAILAGNDMIISSDFQKQKNEILRAINEGKISEDTINRVVRRILACKIAYGIIE